MLSRSFSFRLTLALLLLLLAFGSFVAVLSRQVIVEYHDEQLQRLSHGLARHIVGHWPEIFVADRDIANRAARDAVLSMLTSVNPGVQVYILDADGAVAHYLGEPGMVRQHRVDLAPVRSFLANDPLPLRGTDPMGSASPRLFSAAMFPPRPGDTRPPGYLYVVLDGSSRGPAAGQISDRRMWESAAIAAFAGMLVTLGSGIVAFRRLTLPLHQLARRMRTYNAREVDRSGLPMADGDSDGDEIMAINAAFRGMTARIEAQAARESCQAEAHRDTIAGVAHDLRTPLTALHGHLEILAMPARAPHTVRTAVVAAALAQSDKVRRLSQQLFELAALQATQQPMLRERFRLDELVTDAVAKFELTAVPSPVQLCGAQPGAIEVIGDLQLIERALTNLIENATRHGRSEKPVRVSIESDHGHARILIEDDGPGLPDELRDRLNIDAAVRDPPIRRSSGGIGGLGLAIAQRITLLHGGTLRPLDARDGGTHLSMTLPLASDQSNRCSSG